MIPKVRSIFNLTKLLTNSWHFIEIIHPTAQGQKQLPLWLYRSKCQHNCNTFSKSRHPESREIIRVFRILPMIVIMFSPLYSQDRNRIQKNSTQSACHSLYPEVFVIIVASVITPLHQRHSNVSPSFWTADYTSQSVFAVTEVVHLTTSMVVNFRETSASCSK